MKTEESRLYDVAILGGGWAGLLVARELARAVPSVSLVVLEKESRERAGGLLRSEFLDGFTFDCGGPHILFSKFPEALAEVREILGSNAVELARRNYVMFENQLIPYPFENGLFLLPPDTRARIGNGLIQATIERLQHPNWRPGNFREWMYGVFGDAMAREYLEPYNSKIWKRPLDKVSADWVFTPGRLPLPEISEITRAIAGVESIGYKEQAHFLYPKKGGIQTLYESLLKIVEKLRVEIQFGHPVRALTRDSAGWTVNDRLRAHLVVNTLPLPEIVNMILGTTDLSRWLPHFDYNRVLVVGIALDQPDPNQTAVFVPRSDVPFHRYTWMSYLNPPPSGCSNLIAEVTIPRRQAFDIEHLSQEVLRGLGNLGVVTDHRAFRFKKAWINEYGYPIYTLGGAEAKGVVLQELSRHGVFSVGRWGSWEYWNTDMVLRAVKSLTREIVTSGKLTERS